MQRHLRLRGRDIFQRHRAEGQTWQNRALILSVLPNTLPYNRYGFIITKRQGSAVQRNLLRRRLREMLRLWHPQLKQGYDLVIIARSGSRTAQGIRSYEALQRDLHTLLLNANLLN